MASPASPSLSPAASPMAVISRKDVSCAVDGASFQANLDVAARVHECLDRFAAKDPENLTICAFLGIGAALEAGKLPLAVLANMSALHLLSYGLTKAVEADSEFIGETDGVAAYETARIEVCVSIYPLPR